MVRLREFILPHRRAVAIALLMMAVEAGMDVLKPFPLKWALDAVLKHSRLPDRSLQLLVGVPLALVAIAFVEGLSKYVSTYNLNSAGRTIVFNLRTALFD